jgi:predicted Zn-dependent peptidase
MLSRLYPAIFFALLVPICGAAPPKLTRWTLENGVRVLVLHFEGSQHCAIFSIVPLGLGADGADRTQWSHLVEHLTLRTTGPLTDYRERNAETMPAGMHLDWMGPASKWKAGLEVQAKWLSGLPFDEASLRQEVPKAVSEVDFTVPRGFTHKWAFAAWNQVVRHGRDRVDVRGAIEKAKLADLARYRDEHLVIPGRTLLCIAGGIAAETLKPAVAEAIGRIASKATAVPAATSKSAPCQGDLRAVWDLEARHLIVTWPIPSPDEKGYAALHLAAQALTMALASDPELQGRKAPILASTEAIAPEATFFVVSTPVSEDAKDDALIRKRIDHHFAMLRDGGVPAVAMLPFGLSAQLAPEALDPTAARGRGVPAAVTDAMLEANVALQRALVEWRHKDVGSFASELKSLTPEAVAQAVRRNLTPSRRTTLTLVPKDN